MDPDLEYKTLQFHNQKHMLGECRQRNHTLCGGDCLNCDSRVLPVEEIERFDPTFFFMPIWAGYLMDGRDTPSAIIDDNRDYEECAKMLSAYWTRIHKDWCEVTV
jgi:hypothetical protein